MNNLIKIMISTRCYNNRVLLLRLCRNTKRARNFNSLSEKTFSKIMKISAVKMDFNRITNIRAYGLELNQENALPEKQSDENELPYRVTENQHARNFFHNSMHYAKTIVPKSKCEVIVTKEEALQILSTDWSTAELHDLVYAFQKLSHNIMCNDVCIDAMNYTNIFDTLNKRIPDLNDELLEAILKCLIPFRRHASLDLTKTFNVLDKQCEERFKKWPIDKMFLIADMFYCLDLLKTSHFIWKLMRKINSKLNKLTSKNLAQLLFYVNLSRKAELNMYEVEIRLQEHFDEFTIEELSIVAMGYFKSKSKIRSSTLFRKIIERTIDELDKTDTITLAALIKLLRYSIHYSELVHFRLLLNKLVSKLPSVDLMCIAHIAHAAAKASVYEKLLVDAIIERMCNEIQCARLKDIERVAFMLSTFDIDTGNCIYDKIINEVTERIDSGREKEILRFPLTFLNLLQHLSVKDIYPLHLLKIAMDPSYIRSSYGNNVYRVSHGYSILEHSIKIDCPQYTGPFLDEGVLHTLTKQHQRFVEKLTTSSIVRLFNEVIYMLKESLENKVDIYVGNVLPNYIQLDAIIGIDENQNFVSAVPFLAAQHDKTIKRVDDTFPKNVKWLALVVTHYNHKIKGTEEPIGHLKAKLRQLKRTGFTPILITDTEWLRMTSTEEKINYMKNLLKNV